MCLSARFKFSATLLVSLIAFALALGMPELSPLDEPLAMQTPQR